MEFCGWEHSQRMDKGTMSLVPPALDTISELYKHVLKFVSHFPYKKRLVLYFVFRGTSVKVDLGDAKAAGVVCVLGIGVGLGSLLVYKLYYNYIRPIFSKQGTDTDTHADIYHEDDCCFYSGSSDGAANTDMGNVDGGRVSPPTVKDDSEYGIAYTRSKNPEQYTKIKPDQDAVRLRRKGRRQSSLNSDKDSAIGGASELGQSFYSDGGFNRDSFYSTCTAESGFENMPDNFDDSSSVGEGYTLSRYPSLSQSLHVNFSPKSLNNKNTSCKQSADLSDDKCCLTVEHCGNLEHSSIMLTPPSDDMSSHNSGKERENMEDLSGHLQVDKSDNSRSLSAEYDASLEISESLQSYSGGTGSLGDWSCDEEDRDAMSPLPYIHGSMSDYQFKQSLLQRLREWSSFSHDDKSRSPTPEHFLMSRSIRRSRSLDRHISDVCTSDSEIFENEVIDFCGHTTKNLEHIEDELQDIQDEFSMITSQLSDLISRGEEEKTQVERERSPMAKRACRLVQRARTRWERSPSMSYSDSERSSREGSVDLTWDLGDIGDDELPRTIRNRRRFRNRRQNTLIPEEQQEMKDEPSQFSSCNSSPAKRGQPHTEQLQPDETGDDLEEDSAPADIDHSIHLTKSKPPVKLKTIGVCIDIQDYAEREWRGETPRADTIRQAYAAIPQEMKCRHLKQIRGDNYCAVRACLYQILSEGHHVTASWPGIVDTINKLHQLYQEPGSGLQHWTFANRLPSTDDNRLARMCECVLSLYSTIDEICKLPSYEERAQFTSDLLNSDPTTDVELMEGVKLLMALTSIELRHASEQGEDVPIFVWLMFARDSCQTVEDFIKNHLNLVGNTAGLEQVEMCLLSHTLGTVIQVARLQNFSQEDFLCRFPDDSPDKWPTINLLAEDDRHYNVPIP